MSDYPDVSVSDLPDDAVILDIREQDEWDRGHAPGAIHIPMGELPARVEELSAAIDMDKTLVVTCRSGGRVSRTLPWLDQYGFDVANLEGGMRAWHAAGKAMETADGSAAEVP